MLVQRLDGPRRLRDDDDDDSDLSPLVPIGTSSGDEIPPELAITGTLAMSLLLSTSLRVTTNKITSEKYRYNVPSRHLECHVTILSYQCNYRSSR